MSAQYGGAFFPGASGFNILGGNFTSKVTNNMHIPPPEQPTAFRKIRLGDINLIKEIRPIGQSGVVAHQHRGAGVRRMYSAKLEGRESDRVTVAMYQGDGAEDEWRQDIVKYESIRHPNIVQLYGLVSTSGLCALVFYNELIPYGQFLGRFQHSSILTTYIIGYCCKEWKEAMKYVYSAYGDIDDMEDTDGAAFMDLDSLDGDMGNISCIIDTHRWSAWIRPATGELCVDLLQGQGTDFLLPWWERVDGVRLENVSLDHPGAELAIISNLTEDKYHELCSCSPSGQYRSLVISTRMSIGPGSTLRSDSQRGTLFRIAAPLNIGYKPCWDYCGPEGDIMSNGWTRYNTRRAGYPGLSLWIRSPVGTAKSWLAQANHIFIQLPGPSCFEDYVYVEEIKFNLRCLPNTYNFHRTEGYLFVCPLDDFQTEPELFRWPDCPAYWSLDPSGIARLGTEDAKLLGFPDIHIETLVFGYSWDTSVYTGLWRFHHRKGLDPTSQNVAQSLGYPLLKLSSEVSPSAYVETYGAACDLEDAALCWELGHHLSH